MAMDLAYWFLPKPLDLGAVFYEAMQAEGFSARPEEIRLLQGSGRFHPELSVLASGAFAAGTLACAVGARVAASAAAGAAIDATATTEPATTVARTVQTTFVIIMKGSPSSSIGSTA